MRARLVLIYGVFLLLRPTVVAQQDANNAANRTTQDNAAPQEHVFEIGQGITSPKPIYTPGPEYPQSLRKRKPPVQGTCVLTLVVGSDGTTRDVRVIRSDDRRLDQYAMDAVKKWKFTPAEKDGHPVAVRTTAEVAFVLFPSIIGK